MRKLILLATAALAFLCAESSGQTKAVAKDTAKSCDPKSALLNSPTSYGVQRSTIIKACFSFQQGVENFKAANLAALIAMRGDSALAWLLHGPAPLPAPPVVVQNPPTTPKDSTPVQVPPKSVPAGFFAATNPMPGMGGMPATVFLPVGNKGVTVDRFTQTSGTSPMGNGGGKMRITCEYADASWNDPVVLFGQPNASHLHQFFGRTGVNAYTGPDSIRPGATTCAGGTLNSTGYWVSAMWNPKTSMVIRPLFMTAYYQCAESADCTKIQTIPTGLRMLTGNRQWTGPGPQTDGPQGFQYIQWTCMSGKVNVPYQESGHIPSCPVGDAVHLTVIFPACWNGKDLDALDHKSHLAQPIFNTNVKNGTVCPATHPVMIPQISEHFDWPVTQENFPSSNWRLSADVYDMSIPGGFSGHADYEFGWDPIFFAKAVKMCINGGLNCDANFINGYDLTVLGK